MWLLDAIGLHAEFDALVEGLNETDGLDRFRARVTEIWRSSDPIVRSYVAALAIHTPEDWAAGFDEGHLGEWYRILMAPYLSPTRSFRWPVRLRNRLPDLGWLASDARRLVRGHELAALALTYSSTTSATAVALVLPHGTKGWLGPRDLEDFLERFRSLDRALFRRNQQLVPLVEDAYEVLTTASGWDDRVLLLLHT